MVQGELGVKPLIISAKCRMLNFWLKLITGKQTKCSVVLYRIMREKFDKNTLKSSWMKAIKDLLDQCGLTFVWNNQFVPFSIKEVEQQVKRMVQKSKMRNFNKY